MNLDQQINPLALIILDGFGHRTDSYGNAIAQATMPTLAMLKQYYPWTLLESSGNQVGLLPGYPGNSEVGHVTLGAGRIVQSSLAAIHQTIEDRSFFTNPVLLQQLARIKETNHPLHLMGLLSDGGVHSHELHVHALLKAAHDIGITNVFIHAFLDGRDTPPQAATQYLTKLEELCNQLRTGSIASLHGRFYAMDRDNNQERTVQSFVTLTQSSTKTSLHWQAALEASYRNNITDEFVHPIQLVPHGHIKSDDSVIFFNFRPDRARQLSKLFLEYSDARYFTTMTRYEASWTNPILLEQLSTEQTLLDELVRQKPQVKLYVTAETEKYAHVTYFFRGMRNITYAQEQQCLIASHKYATYANDPGMSASTITDKILTSLDQSPADFYLINYANADMVGHSGNLEATRKACEIIDQELARLYTSIVLEHHGTLFITADHGNAEEKCDAQGNPLTAHTTNPVPFIMVSQEVKGHVFTTINHSGLANVAPTILQVMGLTRPDVMTDPLQISEE